MALKFHWQKDLNGYRYFVWTPDLTGNGYYFYIDGKRVSRSLNNGLASTRFKDDGISHLYGISVLRISETSAESVQYPQVFPTTWKQGIGVNEWENDHSISSDFSRYNVALCGDWNASSFGKMIGPRVLEYCSCLSVRTDFWTGVDYNSMDKSLLLKDASGTLLFNRGYPQAYIGDVGSSSYRDAWALQVIAHCKANGVDGAWVDDTLYDWRTLLNADCPKYPDVTSRRQALLGFFAAIYPKFKAAGLYLAVNAGSYIPGDSNFFDGTAQMSWNTLLAPAVDAFTIEYFMQKSDALPYSVRKLGSEWYNEVDGWQRVLPHARSLSKDFFGWSYIDGSSPDASYVRGLFLLDYDGGDSVLILSADFDPDHNPWGAWTKDFGAAKGPKYSNNGITWNRDFANGRISVNLQNGTAAFS